MNSKHSLKFLAVIAASALLLLAGCGKPKELTDKEKLEIKNLSADATIAFNLRDYDRAEKDILKCTQINPNDPDLWIALGSMQKRLKKDNDARNSYKKALSLHEANYKATKNPVSLLRRAQVLALLGKTDEALKALDKAKSLHPDSPEVIRATAPNGLPKEFQSAKFKEIALSN